jgi:hypothetical protein
MSTPRNFALVALLVLGAAAPSAHAAGVTSVQSPKRVKAGATAKVVASLDAVDQCRLSAGKASKSVKTAGADRATFTFKVSPTAKPGRFTLTLRCGSTTKRLKVTVTARKGKRGTSTQLIKGTIKVSLRAKPQPPVSATPAPPPVPTATPQPVVPGPGNSFRAVYALAADQAETPGYVAGIVATIDAVNAWFASQTTGGVMPRWIRDPAGAPQVRVVTLARTVSDYESAGGFARMVADLNAAAPLAAPTQKSAVFMEINHPEGACASTSAGIAWMTERTCGIKPISPTTWPADATYVTAHELAHNFGAAGDCAPHSIGGGHVGDDTRDLLYAGAGGRDWNNLILDPGRDDYYGTGNTCDIAKSAFWTLTADPRS